LLNSPDQPMIYLSTPAWRSMTHADKPRFHRYHGQETPVLMSAKSTNKLTWKLQTPPEEESIELTQMWMNP
jgi:hypothetical protein